MSSISSVSSVSSVATVSSVSSEDEGYEDEEVQQRMPRIFRDRRNLFDTLSEEDFKARFRLNKATVAWTLNLVEENIKSLTKRNHAIPPINLLLIALRFYATGSFLINIGDHFNVSRQSCGRIVHKVSHHLASLSHDFFKMPSTRDEQNKISTEFFNISGFPNVIGAIDGTHIRLQSPGGHNAEVYRNRKGFFSLNVQVVCDANLKILDVVCRWPGSTHDSRIFNNSLLKARFENNEFRDSYMLGDSAYALRRYMLVPFLNPVTPAEQRHNRAQISTRNTIERTFGVLKRRFPCLSVGLRVQPSKAIPINLACCVLHNIARNMNEPVEEFQPEEEDHHEEPEPMVNHHIQENAVRRALVNSIFTR